MSGTWPSLYHVRNRGRGPARRTTRRLPIDPLTGGLVLPAARTRRHAYVMALLPSLASSRAGMQQDRQARRHVPLRAVPAASGGTRGKLAADAARAGEEGSPPPQGGEVGLALAARRGAESMRFGETRVAACGGAWRGCVRPTHPTAGRWRARERRRARPCRPAAAVNAAWCHARARLRPSMLPPAL